MNKQNKPTDTEKVLMVIRGNGVWRIGEKGEGIKKYKLIVVE